jgi:hypothetical protein
LVQAAFRVSRPPPAAAAVVAVLAAAVVAAADDELAAAVVAAPAAVVAAAEVSLAPLELELPHALTASAAMASSAPVIFRLVDRFISPLTLVLSGTDGALPWGDTGSGLAAELRGQNRSILSLRLPWAGGEVNSRGEPLVVLSAGG